MNAWQAVLDATELNLHDHLFLHALGVSWKDASAKRCKLSPPPIWPDDGASERWLVAYFRRPGPALSQVAGRLGGKDPLPPGFEFLHPPLPIAQFLSAMGEAQLEEDFVGTDFFAGGDVLANLVSRTHENRAVFLHRLIPEDQVAAHYHL